LLQKAVSPESPTTLAAGAAAAATNETPAFVLSSEQRSSHGVLEAGVSPPETKEEAELKHELADAETHYSIFQMKFRQVNRLSFWVIFSLMLIFTIIIDRLQAYAQDMVAQSHTEKMFLERINSELMMFGCVGLFMFIMENLVTHLPDDQAKLVEFVDILCSMGACNLIAEAFTLFAARSVFAKRWHKLEHQRLSRMSNVDGARGRSLAHWLPHLMDASEYQWMATRFKQEHQLPSSFEYFHYLNESLAKSACDLMNIDWRMWGALLLFTMTWALFLYTGMDISHTVVLYFDAVLAVNWASCLCFLVLFLLALRGYNKLQLYLTNARSETGAPKSLSFEEAQDWKFWAATMQICMQGACLTNSFLISTYVMLVNYNLRQEGYNISWSFFMLLPLLLSLVVFMPLKVCLFTVVNAFFCADSSAVDRVLEMGTRLADDLRYLKRQLQSLGGVELIDKYLKAHPTVDMTEQELGKLIKSFGVHISNERIKRICMDLDADDSGTVEMEEFVKVLKGTSI